MFQNIFIAGATGNVGKEVVSQILSRGDTDPNRHENPTKIVGVASSKHFCYDPKGIDIRALNDFCEKKGEFPPYSHLDEVITAVNADRPESNHHAVFVDVTAANTMGFHMQALENGYGIVTANKNPVALCDFNTFKELTEDPKRYGYRCSVMAGAGAVPFIRDANDLGDAIHSLQGCFSGTLGYIATELGKGRKFSEILKEAKASGYTEPDPRDDLNGVDVARKLCILARASGQEVEMDDVEVDTFIPKEYFKDQGIDEFMASTAEVDPYFNERVGKASERSNVLRYVAKMQTGNGKPQLSVSLEEVPGDSSLGRLQGTANMIAIVTDTYDAEKPYILSAPGAGLQVTAQNVRRDLLYQLEGQ